MTPSPLKRAWIETENGRIWAEGRDDRSSLFTPIANLIRALHARRPEEARALARLPIHCDYAPSLFCEGIVRVHAKRLRPGSAWEPSENAIFIEAPAPDDAQRLDAPLSDPFEWHALEREIGEPNAGLPRHRRDRPIAAYYEDRAQGIFLLARNQGATDKTLHAELSLMLWLERNSIPISAAREKPNLYSTLKPCRMCAAAIVQRTSGLASPGFPLNVRYKEPDFGPKAKHTCLNAGSHDQKRALAGGYLRTADELEARLT